MNIKKIIPTNLLFLTLPSIVIAIVSIISALFIDKLWLKITSISLSYVFFLLFHCFKNGAFEKMQYRFTHGHAQLWRKKYYEEMQYTQLIMAGGTFSFFLFKILNERIGIEKLQKYGWPGLIASFVFLVMVSIFIYRKQRKIHAWRKIVSILSDEFVRVTIMLIMGTLVAVILLTEMYILSKTLYVLIPATISAVILLTIQNEGILPLKRDDLKNAFWELIVVMVLLLISLVYQIQYKPKIDYWEIIALLVVLSYPFPIFIQWILRKRKKKAQPEPEKEPQRFNVIG